MDTSLEWDMLIDKNSVARETRIPKRETTIRDNLSKF